MPVTDGTRWDGIRDCTAAYPAPPAMRASTTARATSHGHLRRRLAVEVPAEEVAAEIEKAYAALGRAAKVPGFRPGRVPRPVLERLFGDRVRAEVFGKLIQHSYSEVLEERQIQALGQPEIVTEQAQPGVALRYATPARRISAKLIKPRTISEIVTAVVTRSPAFATVRTSTPSPSAAIATVVSTAATVRSGRTTS